jgi:hypothetical protein
VDYNAFARDLQSFFSELESLNSSLVVTADPSAGGSFELRLLARVATVCCVQQSFFGELES